MKRSIRNLGLLLILLALTPWAAAEITTDYIIVQLQDPPTASYEGGIAGLERTKPLKGKLNPKTPAARAYLAHLDKVHGNYKKWLAQNAPAAKVVRELKVTLNALAIQLNGAAAEKAAGGPDRKAWAYSAIYHPSLDVSVPLIGADVLQAPNPPDAGRGIKIAIIDSGIQDRHPFFACKTIHHHGPYYSGQAPNPPFSPFPIIIETHGTHVAGIAAGCYSDLSVIDTNGPLTGPISGVAPGAELHDFNVFPGIGSAFWNGFRKTGQVSAYSHDIAAAIEDAVLLGMDVINMSLGGSVQGPNDFLAQVADAAVDAGVVVVAAAGNTGPGDLTAESPGSGRNVIAVGMTSNPHFVGIPVTVGTNTYGAALGDFNNFGVVTAPYTVTTPANGCGSITNDLTGQIALVDRGVCTFSEKIRNAQTAGAAGVLVVNNRAGDPSAMGQDGTPNQPTIPAAMLSRDDGAAIKPAGTMTVDGTHPKEFITANADILSLDSSRGPAPFTYLIKPDVSAPGDNVYSSVFNFGPGGFNDVRFDFEFFRGTSMASPHVAGSAALLLAAHPDWTPADVRSALVNSAARVVTDSITGSFDPGVLARGGGRIDLPAATAVPVTFNPASVSFGLRKGNQAANDSATVEVRNVSGVAQSCTVSVTGPSIVRASPSAFTLPAGASVTITVDLNAGKASVTGSGDYEGDVVVSCGATELRVPWFVRIDRKAKLAAARR